MLRQGRNLTYLLALSVVLLGGAYQTAEAATLCVNPAGSGGCSKTIGAAVLLAKPNDTIRVAPGTYNEDVNISAPLALAGAGRESTVINAKGLANGIFIHGTNSVVVAGFTVRNANFQGILVENASAVTITDNIVIDNDQSLNVSGAAPMCPGMPTALATGEGEDCGEGINLTAVDHSIVAHNIIARNAGGILVSDDTGPTHDNLITGNLVAENPFDCGITLASHTAVTGGVYRNTISNNESSNNGLQLPGEGAGVGLFAAGPGDATYANHIIHNRLTGNGLTGVAIHNHAAPGFGTVPAQAPPVNLNDNVIAGNYIAGNHADTGDSATAGPTGINVFGVGPITGTVISGNVIKDEYIDIAVNTPELPTATSSTPPQVDIHLNNLLGENYGVESLSTGTIDARENWWRCAGGPGAERCSSAKPTTLLTTPWLTKLLNDDGDQNRDDQNRNDQNRNDDGHHNWDDHR